MLSLNVMFVRVISIAMTTLVIVITLTNAAYADINKLIKINTKPQGATTILLLGKRRISIGTTPFLYKAKFHSNKSILRINFDLNGYKSKIYKLSWPKKSVTIKLNKISFITEPKNIKNKKLRRLQKIIYSKILPILNNFSRQQTSTGVRLAKGVKFVRVKNQVVLKVPLIIQTNRGLANQIWKDLINTLIRPLSLKINNLIGDSAIQFDVVLMGKKINITPKSEIIQHVDMICVGANILQNVYDSCASRIIDCVGGNCNSVCQPGYIMKQTWNPCASREPVTRLEYTIDASIDLTSGKSLIRYKLMSSKVNNIADNNKLFKAIDITSITAKGNIRKAN